MSPRRSTRGTSTVVIERESVALKRTALLIGAIVGAVVLAGGGAALAVWSPWAATPEATPSATPTPTPTPTPEPAEIPVTSTARAGLPGWNLAPAAALAGVHPEVGDAASGRVALRVDAPVVGGDTAAAHTVIPVQGGWEYTVSVSYRRMAAFPEPTNASLRVGDLNVPFEDADAEWATATATYTAPADATQADVVVVVSGPVTGLSVDDVSVRAEDGTELVSNGSFEGAEAPYGILNDSLVMTSSAAGLAVYLPEGVASWQAQPTAGGEPVTGSTKVAGGLDLVPLTGLPQGHYELQLTDAAGGTVSTAVAVVETEALAVAQDPRFGVGLHVERDWYRGAGGYAAALGFSEARNDILWGRNEPEKGVYTWYEPYEREFDILHANGVKLLGIVNYNNKLYGKGKAPASAEEIAAYGRYAAAVADRFDLVGLEVFNEFNHDRFNDTPCGTSGGCYIPLLQSVHDSVAPAHPDLPIVAGATALFDREFFIGLWQAGGMQYTDAMSFHPYELVGANPDDLRGFVEQAGADALANGGAEPPVWITELGWATSIGGHADPLVQAEMLVRAEISALAGGAQKFFWYDLVNDSDDPNNHEGNFGLYEYAPRANTLALAPKPAAFTQALLIDRLGGRLHTGSEGEGDTVVETFGGAADPAWVAWAPGGTGSAVIDTDTGVVVTDAFGRETVLAPKKGAVTVPLTATPVFVRELPGDAGAPDGGETPSPGPSATSVPKG